MARYVRWRWQQDGMGAGAIALREYSDDQVTWHRGCTEHEGATCLVASESCTPIVYVVDGEPDAQGRADAMEELLQQVQASEADWWLSDRIQLAVDGEARKTLERGPKMQPPVPPPGTEDRLGWLGGGQPPRSPS